MRITVTYKGKGKDTIVNLKSRKPYPKTTKLKTNGKVYNRKKKEGILDD